MSFLIYNNNRCIFRGNGSSSHMKVIEPRSRSQEQKNAKCDSTTARLIGDYNCSDSTKAHSSHSRATRMHGTALADHRVAGMHKLCKVKLALAELCNCN